MKTVKKIRKFQNETGASIMEYVLVVLLLLVIGVPAMNALGAKVKTSYLASSDQIMGGSGGGAP